MHKLWEHILANGHWTSEQAQSIAYRMEWEGLTREEAEALERPVAPATVSTSVRTVKMGDYLLDLADDGTVSVCPFGQATILILPPDLVAALQAFLAMPAEDPLGEALALVAMGLSDAAIAERLGVSVEAVETHLTDLLRTLGLEHRADLAAHAVRRGLVRLEAVDPTLVAGV
jgi:DNA-binding CsgD family transcriptional regulator